MTPITALGLHLGRLGGFHSGGFGGGGFGGGFHGGGGRIGTLIAHAAIWVAIRHLFEAYPEILWPVVAIVVAALVMSFVRRRRRYR
jgi:hypothetical protein